MTKANIELIKSDLQNKNNDNEKIIYENSQIISTYLQGYIDRLDIEENNKNVYPENLLLEDTEMKYKGKTLTKRKDRNLWQLRFRKNGKSYTVYGKTQKETIAKFNKAIKEKEETQKPEYTFEQWYQIYFDTYKKDKIKNSTARLYHFDYAHLKTLYKMKLKDITPIDIQKVLNKIKTNCTKQNVYVFVNSILEKAFINDLITKNVAKLVDKPKYKPLEKKSLDFAERQKFINACETTELGDFYLICLYQGIRKGECLALKVNDIDLKNKTLRIDESISKTSIDNSTKNIQSNRIMPLFNQSIEILKKHIINKNQSQYIFDNDTYSINKVERTIKNICKIANIRDISTHILRHTFITICQEQNIPLYILQTWVGHQKGSVITTKTYTHISEQTNSKYTNLINLEQAKKINM